MKQYDQLEKSLYKYFNYDTFRTGQKEIIQDLLLGYDVFGILPTGTGKSLCYQLTAKLLPGTTIVVSPLISLMLDQVNQLRANQYKDAVAITSFQTYEERSAVFQQLSTYKLIYVSPELLQQTEVLKRFKQLHVSLLVIDEAHCISQWGHEFRPDYLRLHQVIQQLNDPLVLALSATATKDVQADVLRALKKTEMVKHIHPMDRENIALHVIEVETNQEKMTEITNILSDYHVPTLIYFSSRKLTESVSHTLSNIFPEKNIACYHGGMDSLDRTSIQQQFMNDQLDIVCCTNAFGMGIDKGNIRLVIHYHFPSQLESYIQEIGRAGRDGSSSVSVLLYSRQDEYLPRKMIDNELPTEENILFVFQQLYKIAHHQLNMPSGEQETVNTFQVDDIQWRFIYYQLESNGIIKNKQIYYNEQYWNKVLEVIYQYRKDRISLKQRKLTEMIHWMNVQGCFREHLYSSFQDGYEQPIDQCCSNCGFSMADWEIFYQSAVKEKSHRSWNSKLKSLLFIGENDETK